MENKIHEIIDNLSSQYYSLSLLAEHNDILRKWVDQSIESSDIVSIQTAVKNYLKFLTTQYRASVIGSTLFCNTIGNLVQYDFEDSTVQQITKKAAELDPGPNHYSGDTSFEEEFGELLDVIDRFTSLPAR